MDRATALQASNRLQDIEAFEQLMETIEHVIDDIYYEKRFQDFCNRLINLMEEELAARKKALEDL